MKHKAGLREKIAGRLDVKSIIALAVIGVFCVLSMRGEIDSQPFMTIATAVVTFYFARQDPQKKEDLDQK